MSHTATFAIFAMSGSRFFRADLLAGNSLLRLLNIDETTLILAFCRERDFLLT